MTATEQWWLPEAKTIVALCAIACVLNLALVGVLAATGTLKTAERGDISRYDVEETPDGPIEAADGLQFAVERPTDVDAFYNAVVRVESGASMYNTWGDEQIQPFHYHPSTYVFFLPLFFLGYVGFKIGWLLVSLLATGLGTYLLLRAESAGGTVDLSRRTAGALAVASLGFAPMVSNFKTGQTTPVMYLFVALAWWSLRTPRGRDLLGGGALVGPAVFKPYFLAPLVVFWNRHRWRGVLGFAGALVVVNVLSTLAFGLDTLVTYYEVLVAFALESEGSQYVGRDLSRWSSNSLRMFYWFGPLETPLRLVLTAPFAYLSAVHVFDDDYEPEVFVLSTVTVMFLLASTTVIDLAMVLAGVVVLGARLHDSYPRGFVLLALAFLALHVHPYFMEVFVGFGATLVPAIRNNADVVLTVVPLLQPAMYGLLVLWGLALYSVYDSVGGVPRPWPPS